LFHFIHRFYLIGLIHPIDSHSPNTENYTKSVWSNRKGRVFV